MLSDDPSKLDGVQYFIYVVTIIVTLQVIKVLKSNICHWVVLSFLEGQVYRELWYACEICVDLYFQKSIKYWSHDIWHEAVVTFMNMSQSLCCSTE
jgi:hypothetical protein